jgi:hypothetical protein
MDEGLTMAIILLAFLAAGCFVVVRGWKVDSDKERQRVAELDEFKAFLREEFKKLRDELADRR